jgi:hypothetical protein
MIEAATLVHIGAAPAAAQVAPAAGPAASTIPAPGAEGATWIAKLSSGVSVEVIAVSDVPVSDKGWWAPDGSPRARPPIDAKTLENTEKNIRVMQDLADRNGRLLRRFILRVTATTAAGSEPPGIDCQILPSTGGVSSGISLGNPWIIHSTVEPNPKGCVLRARVCTGPWKVEHLAPAQAGGGHEANGSTATFAAMTEREGYAQVTFSRSGPLPENSRLVAVDTLGKVHPMEIQSGRTTAGNGVVEMSSEARVKLTLASIKEVQFQTRSHDQWIEIRGIAVDPRQPSSPTVVTSEQPGATMSPGGPGSPRLP